MLKNNGVQHLYRPVEVVLLYKRLYELYKRFMLSVKAADGTRAEIGAQIQV